MCLVLKSRIESTAWSHCLQLSSQGGPEAVYSRRRNRLASLPHRRKSALYIERNQVGERMGMQGRIAASITTFESIARTHAPTVAHHAGRHTALHAGTSTSEHEQPVRSRVLPPSLANQSRKVESGNLSLPIDVERALELEGRLETSFTITLRLARVLDEGSRHFAFLI